MNLVWGRLSRGFGVVFGAVVIAVIVAPYSEATDLAPGPYAVESKEYRLEAKVDPEILDDRMTEIWARVFFPKDLATGPFPLVGFLHGNHGTCGSGTNPRRDSSSQYTMSGTCPEGYVVTPNHEGYNYVAEKLASHGYIVFSINANRGITAGRGVDGDWGLNLARGRLVLKHLALWNQWVTKGGAPESLGVGADGFIGKVDFRHVGLMGHSRGGEGVRAALNQYRDSGSIWPVKIPHLQVEGIFEIGAVDGQTDRTLDARGSVWNQILPLCDGDVSDLQGANPFNRMLRDPSEPKSAQKSLTMIYGANHNYFNTEWQTSDSWGCTNHDPIFTSTEIGSEKQKAVAEILMTRFFLANVGSKKQKALNAVFNPLSPLPAELLQATRVDRDFTPSPSGEMQLRWDDVLSSSNVGIKREASPSVGLINTDAFDGTAPYLGIHWNGTGPAEVNFTVDAVRDVSAAKTFDFRFTLRAGQKLDKAMDFAVSLSDATGARSNEIRLSQFVTKTFNAFSREIFETIRIPMSLFSGVDFKQLTSIRFAFDASSEGEIGLTNLRFSLAESAGDPVLPLIADLGFTPSPNVELPGLDVPMEAPVDAEGAAATEASIFEKWRRMMFGSSPKIPAAVPAMKPPAPRIVSGSVNRVVSVKAPSETQQSFSRYSRSPKKRYAEVVLASEVEFPIRDALPIMKVGSEVFKISQVETKEGESRIAFRISEDAYRRLRGKELPITVSYEGQKDLSWNFGVQRF